jgi:hypothetical protein
LDISAFVNGGIDVNKGWQFAGGATVALRDLPILGDVGPIGGEFAISQRGLAACVSARIKFLFVDETVSAGLGVNFPGGRPPLNILELLANLRGFLGCDLKYYRPLDRRIVASGAQADASRFTIPKGAGLSLLSIEGAGGAPRVRLRSPGGKVFDFTGATQTARFDDAVGQIVAKEGRTVVFLRNAQAGNWTAESATGSPSIARVQLAKVLPKPKVSGKVSGMGASRLLKYSIAPLDGQQVRFVEDAAGGYKVLKTVKGGGRGSFRYTAGEASGSKRTITAQVTQDGLPRQNIKIAGYRAPNPTVGRPQKVKVKAQGQPRDDLLEGGVAGGKLRGLGQDQRRWARGLLHDRQAAAGRRQADRRPRDPDRHRRRRQPRRAQGRPRPRQAQGAQEEEAVTQEVSRAIGRDRRGTRTAPCSRLPGRRRERGQRSRWRVR